MNLESFDIYIVSERGVPVSYTYRKLHAIKFCAEDPENRKWVLFHLKWPEGMNAFVQNLVNRKEYKNFVELEVFPLKEEIENAVVSSSEGGS